MQIDRDTYHQVLPNAGDLLTLLEPAPDFAAALKTGALHLTCRYRGQGGFQANRPTLILRATDGTADIELPIDSKIGETPSTFAATAAFGGRSVTATLPDSLPAGKYQIFLRTPGRPPTNGLSFTTDLPGK